jgi:hypothetical protein
MSVAAAVVLVAAAGFVAICLVDLIRTPTSRGLPKWAWALIVVASVPLGGIVYLVVGRGGRTEPASPPIENRPLPTSAGPHRSAGSIEVLHLTKTFGATTAVDDLSFTVRPGHVTGFLGPNGAGKTTTMRVVLGLESPSAGSTSVSGRRYQDIAQPLHEVGTLLDAGAAHPGRSARLHVMSVAQSNGIARRRVEEVLDLTGIASVADRRVQEFSLGMKQRLGHRDRAAR